MRALELGAIDFVTKPKMSVTAGMHEYSDEIANKIRAAARANVQQVIAKPQSTSVSQPLKNPLISSEKLLIIGASTGGTEAIKHFLTQLPLDSPGILITQHMPPGFTKAFAGRMDGLCNITVKEAQGGERILPGYAYIAPGDKHLVLARSGANYVTRLEDGPPVSRHKPSVDVLFHSAAENAGKNAVGIIMTGMGKDGAEGMAKMKAAGAYNFAQNEESCVVYGMPKEAIAYGGVHEAVHLNDLANTVLQHLSQNSERAIRM